MKVFLDTDVLIDCLRGTSEAREWLTNTETDSFQIPGIVAMELVVGCQNKVELKRTKRFLEVFEVVWPEADDFQRAYDLLSEHYRASSLSIPDCLIAAMALNRSTRLYSFNLRHFGQIDELDVKAPHERRF